MSGAYGAPPVDGRVGFNESVRPIFVKHCLACHGGVKQAGGLSFVWRETALAEADSGAAAIVPGDSTASALIERVGQTDDDLRMPPADHGPRLTADEVGVLRRWIDAGAQWELPWAFQPPIAASPPEVSQTAWPRSPIDRFVLARIEAEGLASAREADRRQWLRRVSFDLTGLPPTDSEAESFLADQSEGAHERVVDRLLASPHFGERWASVWLDLARYADSMGYEKDPNRTIWPYRDWVIDALNSDLPYDQFLLRQHAGDLLAEPSIEDRIATGFHRNTQSNSEGGTDDEEYRWLAVVDRVDTTWQALLGISMGCARCHDHPYDPLTQEDYYAFAALLNNTRDSDLDEDWPTLAAPLDASRRGEAEQLDRQIADARQRLHAMGVRAAEAARDWTPLRFDSVESTRDTRLVVRDGPAGPEVLTEGTVSDNSRFRLAAAAPKGRVTALRVEVLPTDPDAASVIPEEGFVLSRLRLFVIRAEPDRTESAALESEASGAEASRAEVTAPAAQEEEALFSEVFADEADGIFRPIDSIRDTPDGWGAYTRIWRPRRAVFVLQEPLELREGDRLRLELKHSKSAAGRGSYVTRRLRVAASEERLWTELIDDSERARLRETEERLLSERAAIESVATPVFESLPPSLRRTTRLLDRGAYLAPQHAVDAATPGALPQAAGDRLAMARWLGSEENPLTARVMVNRVWSELFGRGLAATIDDLGSTGSPPSHPALLDWLAVRFQGEGGWRLKSLLREVVLSATYRQDARFAPEAHAADPDNRLLTRGPRRRLTAEMVRDQALMLAGKLNPKLGGPPVMPFQPDGVWQTVANSQTWQNSSGDDRFRRAVYTYWKRTAGYPSMMAFDVPTREQCTARRPATNTPLQALVTLNDPAFVELAVAFAERMRQQHEGAPREAIAWGGRLATGRDLPTAAVDELVSLYEETADESGDAFAMGVVANVILNLDATLSK